MLRRPRGRRTLGRRQVISPIWAFMAQACFISWFAWLPGIVLAPQKGYALYEGARFWRFFQSGFSDVTHAVVVLLFIVGASGPLLSGLGTSQRVGGDAAVRSMLSSMLHGRLKARWYLYALVLPLLMTLSAIGIPWLAGLIQVRFSMPLAMLPLFLLYVFLTDGLQEPGWRGFILPYLERRYSAEQASYLVAALGFLWQWPYLFFLFRGENLFLILIGVALYLVANSVIFTWLYHRTGSLFLTMVYHTFSSMGMYLVHDAVGAQPVVWLIMGLVAWLIAWVLLRRYGPALKPL